MKDALNQKTAAILEPYRARITNYCSKLLNNREDGVEVAQDTLIRAYRNLDSLRDDEALEGWLYTIARNLCYNRLRLGREQIHRGASNIEDVQIEDPDNALEAAEKRVFMEQILTRIRQKARDRRPPWDTLDYQLFSLRLIQDKTFAEIAKLFDKPEGTVRDRYKRHILPVLDSIQAEIRREIQK